MGDFIIYTGIGSNYLEDINKCIYNYNQFIDIINNNKHLFYYDEIKKPIPIIDKDNYQMENLKELVDWCGANFTKSKEIPD